MFLTLMSKANPTHSILSPEVTSKAPPDDRQVNGSVEALTEKLSAALLNCSAKDDLVKQHAKVAEEAVSGFNFSAFHLLPLYFTAV